MKQKQIDEMAKVIEITEQIARDAHCGLPSPRMYATDLYHKGYRKQSEVDKLEYENKLLFDEGKAWHREAELNAQRIMELEAEKDALVKNYAECMKDYAREIFAEIEKIRLKEIHKCETLRERENEVLQRKYWEGGYNSLRQLSYWLAELKKKYIGEQENE